MDIKKPYLLFLGDVADQLSAKTAQGVVDWRPQDCVGQLRLAGCDADVGVPDSDLEDAIAQGAKTLLIGVANSGGYLPEHWRETIVQAIESGLDVASGLHVRLGNIKRIASAAAENGRSLHDVRHPTEALRTGSGSNRTGKRLLCVGTDCSCGKMYTALAIERELQSRGLHATFRATGQTGILIAGSGIAIDAVVADFISGAVEAIAPSNDHDHWDIIEGQGSLFHPSFAGVSLGLLHGSQADALVLCHEPTRTHMRNLPEYPIPGLQECIERNLEAARLTNPKARFVGASINTKALDEVQARKMVDETQRLLDMPATDPFRFGAGPLVDALFT